MAPAEPLPDDAAPVVAAVEQVLDALTTRGIAVDAEQRARIFSLLARLAAAGALPAPHGLAPLLTPILAGTPGEQRICHDIFAEVLGRPAAAPGASAAFAPKPSPEDEPKQTVFDGRTPRPRWRAGALALCVLLTAAALYGLFKLDLLRDRQLQPQAPSSSGITLPDIDFQWLRNYPIQRMEPPRQAPWNRTLRWYYTEYGAAKWAAVLLPWLLLAAALARAWQKMMARLKQDAKRESLRALNWRPGADSFGFGDRRLIATLQPLRRLPRAYTRVLDSERSALASAAAGGLFQARYAEMPIATEFVALIDRQGADDHLAAFNAQVCNALTNAGLSLELFEYDRDPSMCRAARSGEFLRLAALVERFPDSIVLLFADAEQLVDPASDRWLPALDALRRARRTVLFTPQASGEPTPLERQLGRRFDFVVLRTDPSQLPALVAALLGRPAPSTARAEVPPADDDASRRLWEFLRDRPQRWLQAASPNKADLARLVQLLRDASGDPSMKWLGATTIYPVLRWPLTLAMRARVGDGAASLRDGGAALLRICRLPWFRRGAMPEWARRAIQQGLTAPERQGALRYLLDSMRSPGGLRGGREAPLGVQVDAGKRGPDPKVRADRVTLDFLLLAQAHARQELLIPAAWLERRLRRLRLQLVALAGIGSLGALLLGGVALALLPIDECDLLAASKFDSFRIGPGKDFGLVSANWAGEGKRACEAALRREPDNGRYWYQLTRTLAPQEAARAHAAAWQAVRLGHPAGYNALGYDFSSGEGTPIDEAQAETSFRRAIELGNLASLSNLADVERRKGNRKAEFDLLQRHVAAGGDTFALALFYRDGVVVAKDEKRYVELLRLGVSRGDSDAASQLGWEYHWGLLRDEPDHHAQAVVQYRNAIAWGASNVAASNLGLSYLRGEGVEKSDGLATYWFIYSAKRGMARSLMELSLMMMKGTAVFAAGHAPDEAFPKHALLQAAAERGDAQSQYEFGAWLEKQDDAPPGAALGWYRRAAAQKYENAEKALKRLQGDG